jgi:hypothetical protein
MNTIIQRDLQQGLRKWSKNGLIITEWIGENPLGDRKVFCIKCGWGCVAEGRLAEHTTITEKTYQGPSCPDCGAEVIFSFDD